MRKAVVISNIELFYMIIMRWGGNDDEVFKIIGKNLDYNISQNVFVCTCKVLFSDKISK